MSGIANRENEILSKLGFNEYGSRENVASVDTQASFNDIDLTDVTRPDDNATNRQIFTQAGAPSTNYNAGDLWFDTDDDNHIYVANSDLEWVSQRDGSIFNGNWSEIVDDDGNKPDDNATVGAIAGTNFTGAGDSNNEVDDDGIVTRSLQHFFGDGSDGDLTTSGDYTQTSDEYYNNLTISTGDTFKTNGWRLFVKGTLTVNGTIDRIGNDGSNGADGVGAGTGSQAVGGSGGAALSGNFLNGSAAGGDGGDGGMGAVNTGDDGSNIDNATTGANISNESLGVVGVAGTIGATGGDGTNNAQGTAGAPGKAGGTITSASVSPKTGVELILMRNFDTNSKFYGSAGSGGSGGGSGGAVDDDATGYNGGNAGAGGGGGASGGIMTVSAKKIIVGTSGVISCAGGAGGNGGDGANAATDVGCKSGGGGAGSGGPGGSGGVMLLIYNTLTNNGSITVAGGAGGAGGTGGASGASGGTNGGDGSTGNTGNTGVKIELEI